VNHLNNKPPEAAFPLESGREIATIGRMKRGILLFGTLVLIVGLSVFFSRHPVNAPSGEPNGQQPPPPTPTTHEKAEKPDLIVVDTPRIDDVVTSPLVIEGRARGPWFFEASFPVRMVDAEGNVLGQGHAEANGEWMTTDFVSFKAALTFTTPKTATGLLVLEKDNPSGNLDLSDELDIPVRFSESKAGECKKTGCSGQICSDQDIASTCEYSDTYACYRDARCERQRNGECEWTATPELTACLQ